MYYLAIAIQYVSIKVEQHTVANYRMIIHRPAYT